jgi:hypothetical protein
MRAVEHCRQSLAATLERVGAQRQRWSLVVEADPFLGGVEAMPVEPACNEPVGMGIRNTQVGEHRGAVGVLVRARWERQPGSLPKRLSQNGIHESRGAGLSRLASQIDRIIHDGGGGHTIQMQELIETQTQDVNDVFVNLRQRPGGEVLDEMVEAALPAKRSGDDVGRKRAVSLIWHMLPAVGERGGKVDSFVGDGAERTIGRKRAPAQSWSGELDAWAEAVAGKELTGLHRSASLGLHAIYGDSFAVSRCDRDRAS